MAGFEPVRRDDDEQVALCGLARKREERVLIWQAAILALDRALLHRVRVDQRRVQPRVEMAKRDGRIVEHRLMRIGRRMALKCSPRIKSR